MQSQANWPEWAENLRRYKLESLASWLLEAGAPLGLLGAQILYMSHPFVGGNQIHSLAGMLEDEQETHAFAKYLRGEAGA